MDRLEDLVKASQWAERLIGSEDFQSLINEMDKEIARLIQLSEDPKFIEQAGTNPLVLADNLSFRRGIRYVIDYPRRVIGAGERARTKLAERDQSEEAQA